MYATYDYVSAGTLLQETKMELDLLDTTSLDWLLKKYLKDAMGELQSIGVVKTKVAEVEICDLKAKLPCDFIQFNQPNGIRIQSGDYWFYPAVVNGAEWYTSPQYTWAQWAVCSVLDGYIFFSSDLDDLGIAYNTVCLNYQAVLTNENGELVVPKSHKRACIAYAKWKYAQTYHDKVPRDIRAEWNREWALGKKYAKALAALPDATQKQMIYRVMNSLF